MLLEMEPVDLQQAAREAAQLGPARVLQVVAGRVEIEWQGERTWALLALTLPYHPVAGDTVLCIGQAGACYVIGVLRGTGVISFVAPGDVEIRAPRGSIGLVAKKGVHIKGNDVSLTAVKLVATANSVIERFSDATRWIQNAFQLRAGRIRTTVDEDFRLKAGRIIERADGDVKIDGAKIHLG